MTDATAAPVQAGGPEPGPLARIFGVFFSPGKTFESIARKPGWDWLVPIALLMVAVFVSSTVVSPRLDAENFKQQMQKKLEANPNIPEATRDKIMGRVDKQFAFGKSFLGRCLGSVIFAAIVFVVPAVYFAIAAMFGVRKSYIAILATYAYVQLVAVIWWFLNAAVAMSKTDIDVMDAQTFRILKSSPGDFMPFEGSSRFLLTLASYVDVFEILALVLGAIALSKSTKFSPKGAAATVVSVWIAWVLCVAAAASLNAAFGG